MAPARSRDEATVGAIAFHHAPDVVTTPADEGGGPRIETGRPSLVLTGEQSNTTLVYGDAMASRCSGRSRPG